MTARPWAVVVSDGVEVTHGYGPLDQQDAERVEANLNVFVTTTGFATAVELEAPPRRALLK